MRMLLALFALFTCLTVGATEKAPLVDLVLDVTPPQNGQCGELSTQLMTPEQWAEKKGAEIVASTSATLDCTPVTCDTNCGVCSIIGPPPACSGWQDTTETVCSTGGNNYSCLGGKTWHKQTCTCSQDPHGACSPTCNTQVLFDCR